LLVKNSHSFILSQNFFLVLQVGMPGIAQYWHVPKNAKGQFKERFVLFSLHLTYVVLLMKFLKTKRLFP